MKSGLLHSKLITTRWSSSEKRISRPASGNRTLTEEPLRSIEALLMGLGLESNAAASTAVAKGPEVRSAMALVMDSSSGEVIFERNVTSVVPIASITKLMTALVVLDEFQDLAKVREMDAILRSHAALARRQV